METEVIYELRLDNGRSSGWDSSELQLDAEFPIGYQERNSATES